MQVEPRMDFSGEVEGVFEFEEDLGKFYEKPKYSLEEIAEVEIIEPPAPEIIFEPPETQAPPPVAAKKSRNFDTIPPPKQHKFHEKSMASSVPVDIPMIMGRNVADLVDEEFVKPHELAKTYAEHYFKIGLEWDLPSRPKSSFVSNI